MPFTGMQYTVSWNHFAYSSFLTFLTATGGSRGGGGNPAMAPKAQEGGIMSFAPTKKAPKKLLFLFSFESKFGSIPKKWVKFVEFSVLGVP